MFSGRQKTFKFLEAYANRNYIYLIYCFLIVLSFNLVTQNKLFFIRCFAKLKMDDFGLAISMVHDVKH